MKNLRFLSIALFVVSALTFTSCTKKTEDKLPGTWKGTMAFELLGQSETEDITVVFNEDGTGYMDEADDSFTWTADGDDITLTYTDGAETETLNFTATTNEDEHQVWTGSITESEGGFTLTINLTLDIKKQ